MHLVSIPFCCCSLVSVIASALGGVLPALAASAIGLAFANFAFTRPYGSLMVASANEAIDLAIFVTVAALVGVVADGGPGQNPFGAGPLECRTGGRGR